MKKFKLPSTGIEVIISIDLFSDEINFIKKFGLNMKKYKPSNISWNDYSIFLQHWLDHGTMDEVIKSNRQDLKLLFIRYNKYKFDNSKANYHTMTGNIAGLDREIKKGHYPDIKSINIAADKSYFNVLEYLSRLSPPLLPDHTAWDTAIDKNNLMMIGWLLDKNPAFLN